VKSNTLLVMGLSVIDGMHAPTGDGRA